MNRMLVGIVIVVFLGLASWYVHSRFLFYRTPLSLSLQENSLSDQIISGGTTQEGIPAIDEPLFESIAAADQYLDDNGFGLTLETKGRARFYPYQILVWHEVVNDEIDHVPVAVTYCPLSFSSAVYEATLDGEIFSFGVSGQLYNSNTLFVDRQSKTLWSQTTGEAILGERVGKKLVRRLSSVTTWSAFKRAYPTGMVLSRETGASRDYTRNPYAAYETNHAVWFPVSHDDSRFSAKRLVVGFELAEATKAYPLDIVQKMKTIQDNIGDTSVRIVWDEEKQTVRGYADAGNDHIDELPAQMHYWFSWAAFHPLTEVFQTPNP